MFSNACSVHSLGCDVYFDRAHSFIAPKFREKAASFLHGKYKKHF